MVCIPWDVCIAWLLHAALVCVQRGPGTAAVHQNASGGTKEGVICSVPYTGDPATKCISCLCQRGDVGQRTLKIWHDFIHGIMKKKNKTLRQRCVLSLHQKCLTNHTLLYISDGEALLSRQSHGWRQITGL